MQLITQGNPLQAITRPRGLLEAGWWVLGLGLVALADPTAPPALDLCVFKMVGLPGCPGCGLGHAVAFLARGEWHLAVEAHPAAPVVVGVLLHRIGSLLHDSFRTVS